MKYFVLFALLAAPLLADEFYSFSGTVGSGSGSSYSLTGDGRITAIKVWEWAGRIYGIQLRYGFLWSTVAGIGSGTLHEMELFEGEAFIQISGKAAHYIQSVVFVTNMGRMLVAGQPSGTSFNMYPEHREAELRFISGRNHGSLTGIAAHWGVVASNSTGH